MKQGAQGGGATAAVETAGDAELNRKTREFERLTRELEERVAERTRELQESMTKQTELANKLREADRRKDEFLALLAHELRNPLAPVANAVSIMRLKGSDDPQVLWCYDVIDRQAKQLKRLVDDLLDVSRITQGKIQLRMERLDLAAIIEGAVETSRPLIDAQRHRLRITLPPQPVVVLGDASRLTQVVANLLNNAAKYQNEGGSIELSVERRNGTAVIRVADRGIGLSREMLSEAFELFSQAERAPDRVQGGLGIGLSLVRKLVELHDGRVTAASAGIGCGSEFVVRLPCLQQNLLGAGSSETAPLPTPLERSPLRILVVDDNADAAEALAMLLRLEGHEVWVAHEGIAALEVAATEHPEVVILDIGLPGMDGYQVCRRLREDGLRDALIVAVTGYGQERDQQQAIEEGFDDHMVKPVDFPKLVAVLNEYADRRSPVAAETTR